MGGGVKGLSPQAPTHFGESAANWGVGVGQRLTGRTCQGAGIRHSVEGSGERTTSLHGTVTDYQFFTTHLQKLTRFV